MTETVKVTILVAVDESGKWVANGDELDFQDDVRKNLYGGRKNYWVSVDLTIPATEEVQGEVTEEEG